MHADSTRGPIANQWYSKSLEHNTSAPQITRLVVPGTHLKERVQGTTSRTGKNIRNKKNKERVTLQVKILEIEINVQNYMYPTYSLPLA